MYTVSKILAEFEPGSREIVKSSAKQEEILSCIHDFEWKSEAESFRRHQNSSPHIIIESNENPNDEFWMSCYLEDEKLTFLFGLSPETQKQLPFTKLKRKSIFRRSGSTSLDDIDEVLGRFFERDVSELESRFEATPSLVSVLFLKNPATWVLSGFFLCAIIIWAFFDIPEGILGSGVAMIALFWRNRHENSLGNALCFFGIFLTAIGASATWLSWNT